MSQTSLPVPVAASLPGSIATVNTLGNISPQAVTFAWTRRYMPLVRKTAETSQG